MERAKKVFVIQATFDWSDVGSWNELYDFWPKDKGGNAYRGKTITVDSKGNILFADKHLIAAVGLKDTIIVEAGDSLLVCPKDRAQDIKRLVEVLRRKGMKEYL